MIDRVPAGALVLLFFVGLFTGRVIESRTPLRNPEPVKVRVMMPECEEDEVIKGIGDFRSGVWDDYACVHPDTYSAGAIGAAFPEFLESKDGQRTMVRFLCDPYQQKRWYFTVEGTACP